MPAVLDPKNFSTGSVPFSRQEFESKHPPQLKADCSDDWVFSGGLAGPTIY